MVPFWWVVRRAGGVRGVSGRDSAEETFNKRLMTLTLTTRTRTHTRTHQADAHAPMRVHALRALTQTYMHTLHTQATKSKAKQCYVLPLQALRHAHKCELCQGSSGHDPCAATWSTVPWYCILTKTNIKRSEQCTYTHTLRNRTYQLLLTVARHVGCFCAACVRRQPAYTARYSDSRYAAR